MSMYRLQVVTTGYDGSPGYNNFYAIATGGEVAAWVADVTALWEGLKSNLANGTTASFDGNVEQFDIVTGQTSAIVGGTTFTKTGTWGTNKAPGGTALLLRWRTGFYVNGRELRGRSFISGIGDFGSSTGTVGATELTDAQNAAGTYAASDYACVWSPTHGIASTMVDASCWSRYALIRSRRD